jgi:hypothetical protein
MNKTKRTVSQQLNKKMQKELKAAQKPLSKELREYSDKLTQAAILKKYPKRTVKNVKGVLSGFEKRAKANQHKKLKKHSKRTNCGKVDGDSPPAHIHSEGERWIKNTTLQNKLEQKRLQHQFSKRK